MIGKLVEILGEVEENKIWRLSRGFEILLGEDGFEKLKDNLLERQGRIKTSVLFKEFNDIFTSSQKQKTLSPRRHDQADEDALICDLAETYHIYDYKRLPVKLVASLAVGLRSDSRIKIKMERSKVSPDMMMMAAIVDRLTVLVWMQTKDGQHGRNQPKRY